jgi:lipopolysaccharide assembly protein A
MSLLTWLLRVAVFLLLVGFALSNTETAVVRFFGIPQFEWRAPLVLLLLAFFALGALLGVLATMPMVLRRNRELHALRREHTAQAPPTMASGSRASSVRSS